MQLKSFRKLVEKRLTPEEIQSIDMQAKMEVQLTRLSSTFDIFFDKMSNEEKLQFYKDHLNILDSERQIIIVKISELEGKMMKKKVHMPKGYEREEARHDKAEEKEEAKHEKKHDKSMIKLLKKVKKNKKSKN
jgi:hypothetical protein